MRVIILFFILLFNANAFTVQDYLNIRKTGAEHNFLSGYINAIYDNIYFFGGCKRMTVGISAVDYNNIKFDLDIKIDRILSVKFFEEKRILEQSLTVILIPLIKETFNCETTDSAKISNLEEIEGQGFLELFIGIIKETSKNNNLTKKIK